MLADVQAFRRRVRRTYEIGRFRAALAWSLPTLALAALAIAVTRDVLTAVAIEAALYGTSVTLLWWGREPGRGVYAGVIF
jgi:hypothetical protein